MRKKSLWTVLTGLILSSLLFQGCATTSISLNERDLTTLAPLRVVTCVFPYEGVNVRHSGGQTTVTVMSYVSLIGEIVTQEIVKAWERRLEKEIISAGVPRYYELVMNEFVERSSKEITDWPSMVVEKQPVNSRYVKKILKSKSNPLLLLAPANYCSPTLSTAYGFESDYRAVLYDSEGNLLWMKDFEYSSKKYARHRSLEEYKADNFKLLKEEMEFAAEATVSAFIDNILQEAGLPRISAQIEREQQEVPLEQLVQEEVPQQEISEDSGIITITSDPPGAKVFIDGEYKGQTPVEMSLATGTYQLFLEHQLYEPYTDSLTIEQDQTETLNIRLSPEGEE